MKRLRVRATPDPDVAPQPFQLLADSPAIDETRLVELNLGGDIGPTMLFSIDGDRAGLDEALREHEAVHRAEVTPVADGRGVLLLTLQPRKIPLADALFEAFTRTGLVVELPVVYCDGTVNATLLGEPAALQSMLDALPATVTVDIREIGGFDGPGPVSGLSDRQREAVLAGLELGYYDVPRQATHRDVAERLGCAPSTASEHLQKAEAKLVRAGMGGSEASGARAGPRGRY